MDNLYSYIEALCKKRNISITQMCREAGVPRANLTELKMGRQQTLGMTAIGRLALYFAVPMETFYGISETEKAPAEPAGASEEEVRFALFGDAPITDEDYENVKAFADIVAERARKRQKQTE